MKLYIMRHGTTVWNEKRIIQGRSQNRLSRNGKALVEETAKHNKDVEIDVIFASPLMRTMQTANIFNKYHNVKIIKDERLTEIDQGIFSKRPFSSLNDEEKIQQRIKVKSCKMECYEEVLERTKNFLAFLKQNTEFDKVLVVTHSIIASLLDNLINNIEIDFSNKQQIDNFKNAEIRKYNI